MNEPLKLRKLRDRSRQVAYELRRLQSIPEQRVHAVRYEQGGCMVCTRSDTPHGGLGMCTSNLKAQGDVGIGVKKN
jgi:hypothetical protein